jgi:hypothetical protein
MPQTAFLAVQVRFLKEISQFFVGISPFQKKLSKLCFDSNVSRCVLVCTYMNLYKVNTTFLKQMTYVLHGTMIAGSNKIHEFTLKVLLLHFLCSMSLPSKFLLRFLMR